MPARVGQRLTNIRDFLLLAPLPRSVVLLLPSAVSFLFFEVPVVLPRPGSSPCGVDLAKAAEVCSPACCPSRGTKISLSLGLPFALPLLAGPFPGTGAAGEERAVAAFVLVAWPEKPGLVTAGADDNRVNAVP